MTRTYAGLFLSLLVLAPPVPAQRSFSGAAEIEQSLHKLNELGTVLHIAAHPDDERTAVLAYFARGRHMRTAYLSLTRGEGGQNLIGSEQGAQLGVIRTQELLAARQIDGAEQFFTRAIDFGFTRTPRRSVRRLRSHHRTPGRNRRLQSHPRLLLRRACRPKPQHAPQPGHRRHAAPRPRPCRNDRHRRCARHQGSFRWHRYLLEP